MIDNDPILLGRAMLDDLAKQLKEVLKRKSITPEQELQNALDEMAQDVAFIEPDSEDWGWWVTYLLEQLESEEKRGK